jgi:hypothetical protein
LRNPLFGQNEANVFFSTFIKRRIDLSPINSLEKFRRIFRGDNPMTHHIWKLLVFATLGWALPLTAQDSSSIRAALASKDYARALALSRQAFANVSGASEATALTHSVLASAPAEQIPALVVAAVEGKPDLRGVIINAAIDGASKEEAAAILAAVNYVLGENQAQLAYQDSNGKAIVPEGKGVVPPAPLPFVGTVPIYDVLTMPWFNPANSIPVVVIVSPATPSKK